MKISKEEYKELWQKASPSSPSYKTIPAAFLAGGLICLLGQGLITLYANLGMDDKAAAAAASCSLIFLGILLTALRVFDNIAKVAGAGTLVPITGFANSIAAPAIEFKTEGFILGTCVKMFTIAGPVLTLATTASVIYGFIYWLGGML